MQESVRRGRFFSYGCYPQNRQIVLSSWFDKCSETRWDTVWRQVFDYSTECYGKQTALLLVWLRPFKLATEQIFISIACALLKDKMTRYSLILKIPLFDLHPLYFLISFTYRVTFTGHGTISAEKELFSRCWLPSPDCWAYSNVPGISFTGRAVSPYIYRALWTGIARSKILRRTTIFIFRTR